LARAGRKRKMGRRRLDGHLVERRESRGDVASRLQHRRGLPERLRTHEKAESPLGILNLMGIISDEQFEAGGRYARVVQLYRAVIDAPNPYPGSVAGIAIYGRDEIPADECVRRKGQYDDAFEAVSAAGQRAAKAVARVAVYREGAEFIALADLRAGLSALAVHFGIVGARRASPPPFHAAATGIQGGYIG
jgi:hypothetical protein